MPMQIFNAKVRLQGNMHNEVAKRGLTVPEIILLRKIHGGDGVVDIQHVGFADIDHLDERERLCYDYEPGLNSLGGTLGAEEAKAEFEKIFGGEYNPLPEELRDYEGEVVEDEKDHEEFRQSEPYASPNAEDRGAQIRRRAKEKAEAKAKAEKQAASKAAPGRVPPTAVGGKRLTAAEVVS